MTSQLPPSPYVLLDDCRPAHRAGPGRLFQDPVSIIRCDRFGALGAAFAAMEEALSAGRYLAGWLAYDCAAHFEPRLAAALKEAPAEPLIWMGVFDAPEVISREEVDELLGTHGTAEISAIRPSVEHKHYIETIARIHAYLAAGDIYQANYTFDLHFDLAGEPAALYRRLRGVQPVAYGALIDTGERQVISLSPELFVRRDGEALTAQPMKGTAGRGRTGAEDRAAAEWLAGDPKSRAENLMIVDLLRNDLGRIAEVGTVEADDLFEVQRYPTLLQMVSTVRARAAGDIPFGRLMAALFPCGSVTGAPKIRAMEILAELERRPRGVYTGAIGWVAPDGDCCFSVPIRTMTIDQDGKGRFPVGSGIVADSDAGAEYEECLLKARFLTTSVPPDFRLIETMRFAPGEGILRIGLHLDRMQSSAEYFDFVFDRTRIEGALAEATARLNQASRVRLLLRRDGDLDITGNVLEEIGVGPQRACLSNESMDSQNVFLFHKTTNREFYDAPFARARAEHGCFDVVFTNERGELTEGAITNIFIERDGVLLTPPVASGLLAGVLRQSLFDDPGVEIREAVLFPDDLSTADKIYLGNSVRGLIPVTIAA
ncbi:MAG: aminodeoxychorismate synthase component I [Sphingomonadales bacterium]|nr:aminodeoxychorismate synthase component I [Sphingomonadales bacterium]